MPRSFRLLPPAVAGSRARPGLPEIIKGAGGGSSRRRCPGVEALRSPPPAAPVFPGCQYMSCRLSELPNYELPVLAGWWKRAESNRLPASRDSVISRCCPSTALPLSFASMLPVFPGCHQSRDGSLALYVIAWFLSDPEPHAQPNPNCTGAPSRWRAAFTGSGLQKGGTSD